MPILLLVIILGIVEGVTEYLPVSSTGHLILATELLGYDADTWALFNIAIQPGAILAILVLYWRTFRDVLIGLWKREPSAYAFVRNLLVAFVPGASGAGTLATLLTLAGLRFLMGAAQAPLFPVLGGHAIARWFPATGWALPNALTNAGLTLGAAATGPMIAWLIRGTTAICGDGETCIRAASPVLYTLASVMLYLSGRALYGERVGFWSAIVFATLPGVSFSSGLMTTDVPLIAAWTLALFAWVRLLATRRPPLPGGGLPPPSRSPKLREAHPRPLSRTGREPRISEEAYAAVRVIVGWSSSASNAAWMVAAQGTGGGRMTTSQGTGGGRMTTSQGSETGA